MLKLSNGGSGGGQAIREVDTEPPVISLLGNNPAVVKVGDSYVDFGAQVSDNVDSNLGYKVSLDGGEAAEPSLISIDTSAARRYILTFVATDSAGNIGKAERIVTVGDVAPGAELQVNEEEPSGVVPVEREILEEPEPEFGTAQGIDLLTSGEVSAEPITIEGLVPVE